MADFRRGMDGKQRTPTIYGLQLQNYTWLFILASLALITGSTVIPWKLGARVVEDLGFAALVGVYLMWTLERINKLRVQEEVSEYVREVGQNFIKAVYGNELPQPLFEVIRDSIFGQKCIRNVYRIEVTVQNMGEAAVRTMPDRLRGPLSDFLRTPEAMQERTVLMKNALYYEVQNVSKVASRYDVRLSFLKHFGAKYEGLCGITTWRVEGPEGRLLDMLEDPLTVTQPSASQIMDPAWLTHVKTVEIPPGATIKVQLDFYSLRRGADSEPLQSLIPCKGLTVIVTDFDGDKELGITLNAPPVGQGERFVTNSRGENSVTLSVAQYLLPYQGAIVSWNPKKATAGESRASTPESVAVKQLIVPRP